MSYSSLDSAIDLSTALAFALVSWASAMGSESYSNWISPIERNHLLAGKIYDTATGRFVTPDVLDNAANQADFLLLGEIHDNADHHVLQGHFIRLAGKAKGGKAGVVLEMVPASLQPVLDKWNANPSADLAALGEALSWEKRGWPAWKIYEPVVQAAYDEKLPLFAGDLDRDTIKAVGRKGKSALSGEQVKALFLDVSYTASQAENLDNELYESHCRLMPKAAMGPMRLVQQARDGSMARALFKVADSGKTAILIAGAGHVRRDWAIPRILSARRPDAKIVTIAFIEVIAGETGPRGYLPQSADSKPVYDYVYFTARGNNKDHCAELVKRFKGGMKKKK